MRSQSCLRTDSSTRGAEQAVLGIEWMTGARDGIESGEVQQIELSWVKPTRRTDRLPSSAAYAPSGFQSQKGHEESGINPYCSKKPRRSFMAACCCGP